MSTINKICDRIFKATNYDNRLRIYNKTYEQEMFDIEARRALDMYEANRRIECEKDPDRKHMMKVLYDTGVYNFDDFL